jgi:flavin reductase (DIM6/NTAB) family NADH-FMN oxidoreductase RutF
MHLVLQDLLPQERYKILTALVIPRPIALVTTQDENGVHNAAPFSFFNLFSDDQAVIVLGIQCREDRKKDTVRNIEKTREFVVNMVDRALFSVMQICATDFPYGESEIKPAGATLGSSRTVKVQRIVDSPANLECRLHSYIDLSPRRVLILGEVLCVYIKDEAFDLTTKRIVPEHYKPLARLYGTNYAWMGEPFSLPIEPYASWKSRNENEVQPINDPSS